MDQLRPAVLLTRELRLSRRRQLVKLRPLVGLADTPLRFQPAAPLEPVKGGRKKTSVRKFFPGYILVKMELDDKSWHFIRNIPKVIGFVGGKLKDGRIDPDSVPDIPEPEVLKIKQQIEEGTLKPKPKVSFDKGETVKVIEGPFANFSGVIEEVRPDKAKVQVLVTIFGRTTPIELDFNQVEKI